MRKTYKIRTTYKKQFEAVLNGLEDGILSFTTEDEKEISIPKDKAAKVNSESQLYKQAGNSIVVNVLMAIFKEML